MAPASYETPHSASIDKEWFYAHGFCDCPSDHPHFTLLMDVTQALFAELLCTPVLPRLFVGLTIFMRHVVRHLFLHGYPVDIEVLHGLFAIITALLSIPHFLFATLTFTHFLA